MAHQSTVDDTRASNSFRSFWRKTTGREQEQITGREQEQDAVSSAHQRSQQELTGRLSRLLKPSSSPSSDSNPSGANVQTDAQKRRQQVYQAQKRHRNRKAEYTQCLEEEVARLQQLDAKVNSEKTALSRQNEIMRNILASRSLDFQLESMGLQSELPPTDDVSSQGVGTIDIRFDPDMGHERVFLDLPSSPKMQWAAPSSQDLPAEGQHPAAQPEVDDNWAALDFILALEWPCRNHIHHYALAPDAWTPEPGEANGHALTATAAVFASAKPPATLDKPHAEKGHARPGHKPSDTWHMPHCEIDKLVEMSEGLGLDESEITPAQAYSAIRGSVSNLVHLRPVLEALKQPLGKLVHCVHFGAVLDTANFWEHFSAAISSLQSEGVAHVR